MATFYLSPLTFIFQYLNDVGVILPGGKINTYLAGTSTPQATYTDITGGTPNANPIILNSAGRLPSVAIWQPRGVAIKATITDANNNAIGTPIDQISGINDFSGATGGISVLSSVSGTNTITASVIPAISSYQPGSVVELTPAATNTGATTLSISGLSSIAVQIYDGTACIGGELVINIPVILVLNAAGTAWIIQAPANSRLLQYSQKSGNYTFTQLDSGFITYFSGTGLNIDFPATGIAPGTLFKVRNNGSGSHTLRQPTTAGNLAWYSGAGISFGNRTLAVGGTVLVSSTAGGVGFFEVEGAGIS